MEQQIKAVFKDADMDRIVVTKQGQSAELVWLRLVMAPPTSETLEFVMSFAQAIRLTQMFQETIVEAGYPLPPPPSSGASRPN